MNFIDFRVNNESLDVGKDLRIRLSLISPLFSGEIGYNSQSFSFTLPNSPRNRRLLGFPDLITQKNVSFDVSADLWLGGNYFDSGSLRVSPAGPYSPFQVVFLLGISPLVVSLAEKSLHDYTYDGIRAISSNPQSFQGNDDMVAHANAAAASDIDSYDYTFFPIKNPSFYLMPAFGGPLPGDNGYMNYWQAGSFIHSEAGYNAGIGPFITNLVPQPYLLYIMRSLIEEEGYSLADSDWTLDSEIKTLTIYNTYSLDDTLWSYPFGPTLFNAHWYKTDIDLKNHVPDISAKDFILGICRNFNLAPIIKRKKLTLLPKKDLVVSTDQTDWRDKCITYSHGYENAPGYSFFSDQDEEDLLNGSNYVQSEGPGEIHGTVDTYADLPVSPANGLRYYVKDSNTLYLSGQSGSWVGEGYYLFPVLHEDGAEDKPSPVSTTETYNDTWHDSYVWRIPYTDQLGNSENYFLIDVPFAARLLFYRGLVTDDPTPGAYPQATCDDKLGAFNYSLFWHGDKGLYETWWKPWLDKLLRFRPITTQMKLDLVDLLNLAWETKVRIRAEEGEATGFMRKIDIEISQDSIKPASVEIIPTVL